MFIKDNTLHITVLSLFDGMGCGRIALEKLKKYLCKKYKVEKVVFIYYASEIKKVAIKCSNSNWEDIIQIGDVTKVRYQDNELITDNGVFKVDNIDLLIGGSPCQNFSVARTSIYAIDGLEGDKSKLFYEYLRILKESKPTYFLLENVKMKNDSKEQLDNYLGFNGIYFNSRLVSYQNRPRYYWTNIDFKISEDKKVSFQDFKETDYNECKKYKVNRTPSREKMWCNGQGKGGRESCKNITYADKINCITRKQDRSPNSGLIELDNFCRFLSRRELEQGQTVPVGYTKALTYSQAQDVLGDGWTVDVIVEILKGISKVPKVKKYIQGELF